MATLMNLIAFVFLVFIVSGWAMLIASPMLIFLYGTLYGSSTLYQSINRFLNWSQLKIRMETIARTIRNNFKGSDFCSCVLEKNGKTHIFTQVKINDHEYSHHFTGHNLEEAIQHTAQLYSKKNILNECEFKSQICKEGVCTGTKHCPRFKNVDGFFADAKRYYKVKDSDLVV